MLDNYENEIRVGDCVAVTQSMNGGYSKKYQIVTGEVYKVTESKIYFTYEDPETHEIRKSYKVNSYAVAVIY